MKQITLFSFALFIAACGNHEASSDASDSTTPPGKEGVGVAITVFAQWQRPSQGNVDGEYDAKEGMFIPCGSDQGVSIQQGDVKIISGGSCDGGGSEKMEPMIRIIKRTRTSFNVVSRNVSLQDVAKERAKVQYQTNEGAKQIVVDPETMNRLRAEKTIMQKAQR